MTVTSWLEGLASRGVVVYLRKNRVSLSPYTAYKELTDDELLFLRHHRAEIKDAVGQDALRTTPGQAFTGVVLTDPAPLTAARPLVYVESTAAQAARAEPESQSRCEYCHGPCVGQDHHSYRIIHHDDPEEVARRRAEQERRDEFDRRTWTLHDRVRFTWERR